MASKGAGSSAQGRMFLQRSARLYEGESWWLCDQSGEVRGLLLLDDGEDLGPLRDDLGRLPTSDCRFVRVESGVALKPPAVALLRTNSTAMDCQVTVEERTQLFGFLRKGAGR